MSEQIRCTALLPTASRGAICYMLESHAIHHDPANADYHVFRPALSAGTWRQVGTDVVTSSVNPEEIGKAARLAVDQKLAALHIDGITIPSNIHLLLQSMFMAGAIYALSATPNPDREHV